MCANVAMEHYREAVLQRTIRWRNDVPVIEGVSAMGLEFKVESSLRKFWLGRYGVQPLSGNCGVYWDRNGTEPPVLRSYLNGSTVPEQMRGQPLSYYAKEFKRRSPQHRLRFILSFGDAGVNENRGLLTADELLFMPGKLNELST